MSLDAAQAFRTRVSDDPALQAAFGDAYARGPAVLSELARSYGYDVSPGESAEAVAAAWSGGELTDYELELVAGGGDPAANIGGGHVGAASTKNSVSTTSSPKNKKHG